MAEYVELYIDQGSDFSTTITINDDNTNLPIGLLSVNAYSHLRRSILSTNASASFVCSIQDPANGEIVVSMSANNTANLKAGRYFFDLNTVDGNVKSRLIEGIVIVTPAITR